MLEEVAAEYDEVILDYASTMKSEEYLAVNRARGSTVTECAAICAYLAEACPHADLAPPAAERADY